jgi:hypothetical protein
MKTPGTRAARLCGVAQSDIDYHIGLAAFARLRDIATGVQNNFTPLSCSDDRDVDWVCSTEHRWACGMRAGHGAEPALPPHSGPCRVPLRARFCHRNGTR